MSIHQWLSIFAYSVGIFRDTFKTGVLGHANYRRDYAVDGDEGMDIIFLTVFLFEFPFYVQETQERTRKRIKEDVKDSTLAYNEYAEGVLPRLKSRYAKKYSEVDVRSVFFAVAIKTHSLFTRSKSGLQLPFHPIQFLRHHR